MKKMTCNELGGACDLEFKAETFEEMAELSKNHGMEMFQKGDQPHLGGNGASAQVGFFECVWLRKIGTLDEGFGESGFWLGKRFSPTRCGTCHRHFWRCL